MKRRSFGVNLGVSVANVVAVVGVSLAVVPLLIDRLGLQGYGLWVLAQSVVIYVTAAENGFGPALARFTSVHGHHPRHVRPMLALALVLYAAVGAVVLLACHVLAVPLVDAFDVPRAYHADAVHTVHLLGWVALVALLAAGLGHVMDGLERFTAYTITNALGSAAFLIWLLASDRGLQLSDVAIAALIQWSLVGLLRLVALRDVILARGSLIPSRTLVREIFGFSMRLQVAVMATLLNTQTDRVVIGIVSSAKTLGQVGIATQVAEAGRFLAYATFTPLAARLATAYGTGGLPALDALLHRYRRLWTLGVLGVLAVGVGAARPAITAWVGGGHDEASVYAALLLVGYGVGLLPSPAFAYLRAIGRPGLEGLFGVVTVAVNLAATLVMGLTVGAAGVIAATTVAYLATTVWIMRRVRGEVPSSSPGETPGWHVAGAVLGTAAFTYLAGQALLEVLPRLAAFAGIGLVVIAAAVGYAAAVGLVAEARRGRRQEARC
ncbi:lipopolysaccharide biosynthesis protein [Baekduia sp. Peel2402]|uniref:lipopolysaccharide biosynthesis protein n=1 Tax=Baekduia sp. Peel2402 TaxID=3458296 RepID=UPI00403E3CA4